MDWLIQRPIAHRGLHKGFAVPENSYRAFQNAINKGYSIELDVRITKDKQVVVFHDKNLLRMCGIKKKIANQNYINLKEYTLYSTSQKIPLLREILELVNGQVPLLFEIKNYGEVGEFEKLLILELSDYHGKYAVSSFNNEVIKWFKDNHPNIIRGFIYGDLHKFNIKFSTLVFLLRIIKSKPNFISLDYKLLDTFLPTICRLFKKPLICWTVNDKRKFLKAEKKADNIIFENIKLTKYYS